eukprot:scaffold107879_cov23-Cyclotella_meneghiniana.AAC.4
MVSDIKRDELFEQLFESFRERFVDPDDIVLTDSEASCDNEPLSSLLDQEWLTPEERLARQSNVDGGVNSEGAPDHTVDGASEGATDGVSDGLADGTLEGAPAGDSEGASDGVPVSGPRRSTRLKDQANGKWKSALLCGILSHTSYALSAVRSWGQPPPSIAN